MNTIIQTFHNDHYLPVISKLAFHILYCTILGTSHCGKLYENTFKEVACQWIPRPSMIIPVLFLQICNQIQYDYYYTTGHCSNMVYICNNLSLNEIALLRI